MERIARKTTFTNRPHKGQLKILKDEFPVRRQARPWHFERRWGVTSCGGPAGGAKRRNSVGPGSRRVAHPVPGRDGAKTRRTSAPLYLSGLRGPGDRKSLQPMAARLGLAGHDPSQHPIACSTQDDGPLWTALAGHGGSAGGRIRRPPNWASVCCWLTPAMASAPRSGRASR